MESQPVHKRNVSHLEPDVVKAFDRIYELALEYMSKNHDRNELVVDFKTPAELEKEISIKIENDGSGFDNILNELEKVLKYSVRTGHVRFFNQLWAGTDKAAVIGEWLTTIMNTSMYTYEVCPVFTMMEIYLLQKLRGLIGWKEGDGVFAPGGAHCNLLGMLAARNMTVEHVKKTGIQPTDKLVCFTSEHSHYTVKRSASVMGMGTDACINVKVDDKGKIIPAELEKAIVDAIAQGKKPFCISITSGTTVLGAYDPIDPVADIAEKYKIWLHVDACWGGHCLLSQNHKALMAGCHRADSIAWTGTKCLGLPQQCSALLLKKKNVLYSCNAMKQDYLFHDHEEKDFDLGDRTLNCGRRVDALKLWVSWKVYGDKGFEERVDHAFDQASYMVEKIKAQPEKFKLLAEPESLNVCFWYIPPSARGLPEGEERDALLDKATVNVRRKMQLEGKVLVNYSDLQGVKGHFWRMITCNPGANKEDIDFVLSEIDRIGSSM